MVDYLYCSQLEPTNSNIETRTANIKSLALQISSFPNLCSSQLSFQLQFTFSRTFNCHLSFIMLKTHQTTPTGVTYTHWKCKSPSFQQLLRQSFSPPKNSLFALAFICNNQPTDHYRHELTILHRFQHCKSLHKLI